jgi:hypothetical protein
MKRLLVTLLPLAIAGCPSMGYQNMTADQIKATAGTISCSTITTIYGKGSTIAINADDIKKGQAGKGKNVITCGEASMTIESEVGKP